MTLLADEDDHALVLVAPLYVPAHRKRLRQARPRLTEGFARQIEPAEFDLDPHEELTIAGIGVLVRFENVPVMLRNERRHRGDNAFAVGTIDEKSSGFRGHG